MARFKVEKRKFVCLNTELRHVSTKPAFSQKIYEELCCFVVKKTMLLYSKEFLTILVRSEVSKTISIRRCKVMKSVIFLSDQIVLHRIVKKKKEVQAIPVWSKVIETIYIKRFEVWRIPV
jgi:hypothetical protein